MLLPRLHLRASRWSSLHLQHHSRCASTAPPPLPASGKNKWSDTLLLPRTDFPMKHKNPVAAELVWRERTTTGLYRWQWENNRAAAATGKDGKVEDGKAGGKGNGKVWILHDGPPYANGNLHMGEPTTLHLLVAKAGCTSWKIIVLCLCCTLPVYNMVRSHESIRYTGHRPFIEQASERFHKSV